MNKERQELFDAWAEGYDISLYSGTAFPFDGYDDILDEVLHQASAKAGMKVLDLGIGTGNLAEKFVKASCKLTGIDFSAGMLAEARSKLPDVTLIQTDLLSDFPAELERSFDCIVSSYVFHEFDLITKLKLIRRLIDDLLIDEGRILIADQECPRFFTNV